MTVASEGDSDNEPVIEKILTLRQEKARLLGYESHAEVSMASKVLFHTLCVRGVLPISRHDFSNTDSPPFMLWIQDRCHVSAKFMTGALVAGTFHYD